jgi:hypothetical protein
MNRAIDIALSTALQGVTRLETVDHSACTHCKGTGRISIAGQLGSLECPACHGSTVMGRSVVFWDANKKIELSLQDEGRTLKVFIKEREDE